MKTALSVFLIFTTLFFSAMSYGGSHKVKKYTKRNGTVVKEHRRGNPRSGTHCKNNVCS